MIGHKEKEKEDSKKENALSLKGTSSVKKLPSKERMQSKEHYHLI